jgi:hypothetical protein
MLSAVGLSWPAARPQLSARVSQSGAPGVSATSLPSCPTVRIAAGRVQVSPCSDAGGRLFLSFFLAGRLAPATRWGDRGGEHLNLRTPEGWLSTASGVPWDAGSHADAHRALPRRTVLGLPVAGWARRAAVWRLPDGYPKTGGEAGRRHRSVPPESRARRRRARPPAGAPRLDRPDPLEHHAHDRHRAKATSSPPYR